MTNDIAREKPKSLVDQIADEAFPEVSVEAREAINTCVPENPIETAAYKIALELVPPIPAPDGFSWNPSEAGKQILPLLTALVTTATAKLAEEINKRNYIINGLRCDISVLDVKLESSVIREEKLQSKLTAVELKAAEMKAENVLSEAIQAHFDKSRPLTAGESKMLASYFWAEIKSGGKHYIPADHPTIKAMWQQLEVVYGGGYKLCQDYQTLLEPTLPTVEDVTGIYKKSTLTPPGKEKEGQ